MIVVCGEALIDLIDSGDGNPRPAPGGAPFNTARALARLGVPTAFLGRLSDDEFGRQLAGLLTSDGVSLSLAPSGTEPTTTAIARVDGDGVAEYEFLTEGTSAPNLSKAMLPDRLSPEVEAIHLGTLGLMLEPIASTLVDLVRRESGDRLVMLDPNIRPALVSGPAYRNRLDWVVSHSTIVKVSKDDLAWLFPTLDIEAASARILTFGVRLLMVTLGPDGALGVTGDSRAQVSAPPIRVVDTIGAGDAFGAASLAWLHERGALRPDLSLTAEELESLLSFACLAASLTCTHRGAEPPWRSELPDPDRGPLAADLAGPSQGAPTGRRGRS